MESSVLDSVADRNDYYLLISGRIWSLAEEHGVDQLAVGQRLDVDQTPVSPTYQMLVLLEKWIALTRPQSSPPQCARSRYSA